jgi:hypothetical protein
MKYVYHITFLSLALATVFFTVAFVVLAFTGQTYAAFCASVYALMCVTFAGMAYDMSRE